MSGVLWQDQQTSWEVVPHVLVPRYVRKYTVLNDLRKEKKLDEVRCGLQCEKYMLALCSKVAAVLIEYEPASHSFFPF